MPIKDIIIDFLLRQDDLLKKNDVISRETREKRISDIHRLVGKLGGGRATEPQKQMRWVALKKQTAPRKKQEGNKISDWR